MGQVRRAAPKCAPRAYPVAPYRSWMSCPAASEEWVKPCSGSCTSNAYLITVVSSPWLVLRDGSGEVQQHDDREHRHYGDGDERVLAAVPRRAAAVIVRRLFHGVLSCDLGTVLGDVAAQRYEPADAHGSRAVDEERKRGPAR